MFVIHEFSEHVHPKALFSSSFDIMILFNSLRLLNICVFQEEPASTIMSGFDSSDDEGESDLSPFPIAW